MNLSIDVVPVLLQFHCLFADATHPYVILDQAAQMVDGMGALLDIVGLGGTFVAVYMCVDYVMEKQNRSGAQGGAPKGTSAPAPAAAAAQPSARSVPQGNVARRRRIS